MAACDRFPIRGATMSDAVRVFDLIDDAKTFFKANGIDMWQRGYPQFVDIADDISSGNAYVCTDGELVVGYIFVTFEEEDFHSTLEGKWEDDDPAVFHRIIVDPDYRHCGIGKELISFAEDLAKDKGCTSMRTETDVTNTPMTSLMAELGYSERGPLIFRDFQKLAFEKVF